MVLIGKPNFMMVYMITDLVFAWDQVPVEGNYFWIVLIIFDTDLVSNNKGNSDNLNRLSGSPH